MPDIHVPKLDEQEEPKAAPHAAPHHPQRSHYLKLALEVILISLGVFLGLAGEQLRESARHRELAEDALRRFRTELIANRKSVAAVKDYHANLKRAIDQYLSTDPARRIGLDPRVKGLQPASFDRTAWDLAIATQALVYIDSNLAYSLAQVYDLQRNYAEISREVLQALYIRPPRENMEAFYEMLQVYYGDIVFEEPALLERYDGLIAKLNRVIGEPAAASSESKK